MKYQKFQAPISKRDVFIQKNDQMLWFVQKPNEKLLSFVIIFLWEVIYVHFYNWDKPLDLVPVVYDLIELIIEASFWTKDYSTFDTHPQHTSLVQLMLISFVWLYMFKCDVYAQLLADQTQKDFWVFYMFLKVILYFHALSFYSKCIFVLFFKNLFRGIFARSLQLIPSREKIFREKLENTSFIQRLSWLFRD